MQREEDLVHISPSVDGMLALEIASSKPPETAKMMQTDEDGKFWSPADALRLHLLDAKERIFVYAKNAGGTKLIFFSETACNVNCE